MNEELSNQKIELLLQALDKYKQMEVTYDKLLEGRTEYISGLENYIKLLQKKVDRLIEINERIISRLE